MIRRGPRSVLEVALAVALTLIAAGSAMAQSGKRVALVIGNAAYKNVSTLDNPANDADAVADLLRKSSFQIVDVRHDLGINGMRRAVRDFSDLARDADIGVVYYAGHGIEVDGTNYLIPVDAVMERDVDVEDESLPLDRILRVLEPVKRLRLVILDACRDNPFARTMKRTLASRSVGRGLAKIEPTMSDTLIAFAAKAGSTAADGEGKNSPFTIALVKHVAEPGLDLRLAFGRVRDEVLKTTGNKQEPYVYGSLGGSTVSLTPPKPTIAPAPAPQIDINAGMRRDYELAAQIGTKEAWDFFLAVHTKGLYANLARAARAKIIAAEKAEAAAAEAKAKAEAAEKAKAANAAAERAKAESAKRAAEAADRAKVEAAEKARIEAQKSEAKRLADEQKAAATRKAAEAEKARLEAAEKAKAEADKAEAEKIKVAALPAASNPAEVTRSLQTELRRVGCHVGSIDGRWNVSSKKAMEHFNRFAGMQLDVKVATEDALDAVRSKKTRVCPLVCQRGFRTEGERCVAVTCPRDQVIGDDGTCRKKPAKSAARPEPKKPPATREPRSTGGGQESVICDTLGCRSGKIGRANRDGSLPAGCQRVNTAGNSSGIATVGSHQIICN
jgi:uncharacterized caspase-like protein